MAKCRPGDMAVIVHSDFPANIGAFVTVLSVCEILPMTVLWFVRPQCPERMVGRNLLGFIETGNPVGPYTIEDFCLEPIRPPGKTVDTQNRQPITEAA